MYETGAAGPTYPLTGFVLNDWYRLTLYRSNDLARVTMAGTGVSVDSGWQNLVSGSNPGGVALGGYAAILDYNPLLLDNFQLDAEPFVPEPAAVLLLGVGGLLVYRQRKKMA